MGSIELGQKCFFFFVFSNKINSEFVSILLHFFRDIFIPTLVGSDLLYSYYLCMQHYSRD